MDDTAIPFARPFIGQEEEEAVLRVLRSGWLTTGREALAFEEEFTKFLAGVGPVQSFAVNSATSGLHLALEACGIGSGDLVLVPSYTFVSTAEVVRYLQGEVVFVDTQPGTFHLDPEALEASIQRLMRGEAAYKTPSGRCFGPRGLPKAVIPVHYGGLPHNIDAVMAIARRYDLKVVEDAAHAFPSRLEDGRWAGTIGDVGVFSFYATKTLTTAEGGMVVSRDAEIPRRIGLLRSHGIDRSVWNRYTDTQASWYYAVVAAGYKYNMPDLLAALGRVQLARAAALLDRRIRIATAYDEAFQGDRHFSVPPTGPGDARHLYPLRLNRETLSISRDAFIQQIQAAGVGVSVHFIPLHCMPYYQERYGLKAEDLPASMESFHRVISLPIWPGMQGGQVDRVIETVKTIAREHALDA
ncbi:MAG: DegT/DnrJ/EryC1/StrS family aminotransferase [Spirochaetaceae bacterium]|jgi:dTDP-4-amino-4,6-dideoxygalactose transaminase|nr:DegT/DnrJ/EryC1/StrS family aminotransferase [Spirochaetaceae bacterium]